MSDLIIELAGPIFRGILKIIGYIILEVIGELIVAAIGEVISAILNATGLSRVLAPYQRGCAWVFFLVVIATVVVIIILAINGNAASTPHF